MGVRFSVRVRCVGGVKGRRPALGITIPIMVCEDLDIKEGDKIRITIERA